MARARHTIPPIEPVTLDPVAIGRRVRRLRRATARGYRQIDLTAASGIDDAVIGLIELGKRTPSMRSAIALAQTFQRPLGFILFGAEDGRFWGEST